MIRRTASTLTHIILLLLLADFISAQELILQNGAKSKKISADQWVRVMLPYKGADICETCQYQSFTGKIISTSKDRMVLLIQEEFYLETLADDDQISKTVNYGGADNQLPEKEIKFSEVLSITPYGKGKRPRQLNTGQAIGAGLIMAGAGSLISAPLAENTGDLLLAGGGSILAGLILGIASGDRKSYLLSKDLAELTSKPLWIIATN